MGLTAKGKAAYERYKKLKKAKEHYTSVKNLLDKDTRTGELVKLGFKGMIKLAEKVTGSSLGKHPYFAYHKKHIEALASALNATEKYKSAMQALHSAVTNADSAELLAKSVKDFNGKKGGIKLLYMRLYGALQTLQNLRTNPEQGRAELREIGTDEESLRGLTERELYEWRAAVCEVYFDAVDLLAMVDVEYRGAAAAMDRYNAKIKKMNESKQPIDRIAGKAAERDRQYEELERWNNRRKNKDAPSDQAVADPTGHAKRQRDNVDEVVQIFATICDVAMSDDSYAPAQVNLKIGNL